jgi:signal transduction histidine kinase
VARLGVLGALKQTVEAEFGRSFDDVLWEIDPQAEAKVNSLVPLTAEVLFYASREAIRNAARHGRNGQAIDLITEEPAPLHLYVSARCLEQGFELVVEDNGVGLETAVNDSDDEENNNGNGRSGPNSGGSGGGLALHSTLMAVVGGTLSTESVPGDYTRVSLMLPLDGEGKL